MASLRRSGFRDLVPQQRLCAYSAHERVVTPNEHRDASVDIGIHAACRPQARHWGSENSGIREDVCSIFFPQRVTWYIPLTRSYGGTSRVGNRAIMLNAQSTDTVSTLKKKYQNSGAPLAARQRLSFAGTALNDTTRTLSSYGIGNGSIIEVL